LLAGVSARFGFGGAAPSTPAAIANLRLST